MAKIIKTITFNFKWSGDCTALRGFNVSLTTQGKTPTEESIITIHIDETEIKPAYSCVLKNITLDSSTIYTAWVQACYPGKDSDWKSSGNLTASDDGSSTIASQTQLNTTNTNVSNVTNKVTNLQQTGLGMKVNFSSFTLVDPGEIYLHGFNPVTGVSEDIDGWVWWNGMKVTIPKGMINPNDFIYNNPIYVVFRTSNSTKYQVAYFTDQKKWKYTTTPTKGTVSDWAWNPTTDIILCSFIEPSNEGSLVSSLLYTPPKSPEDVTVSNEINNKIKDVQDNLDNFDSTITGTFRDGIIEEAEAKAIKQNLNIIQTDKAQLDKDYSIVYGNTKLDGTAKTNLNAAKTDYDSKYNTLVSTVNSAIADGKATSSEATAVNNAFTNYKTSIGTLKQRLQEALDYISTKKIDDLQISAKNLARGTTGELRGYTPTTGTNSTFNYVNVYTSGLKVGDTVTVAIDVEYTNRGSASGQTHGIWFQGAAQPGSVWTTNPFTGCIGDFTSKLVGTSGTIHLTGKAVMTAGHLKYEYFNFGVRSDYSNGTATYKFKNLMVVRGEKEMDWTPAPEDIDASINEATSNTILTPADKISFLATYKDALKANESLSASASLLDLANDPTYKTSYVPAYNVLKALLEALVGDVSKQNSTTTNWDKTGYDSAYDKYVSARENFEKRVKDEIYKYANGEKGVSYENEKLLASWASENNKLLINGGKIYLKSISGESLMMNTITAKNIAIGDFTNYVTANPNYPETTKFSHTPYGEPHISDGYLCKANVTDLYFGLTDTSLNSFTDGDELYFEFTGRAASVTTVTVIVSARDKNASYLFDRQSETITLTTADKLYSGSIKLTGSWTTSVYYNIGISNTAATKVQVFVKNVKVRKKNAGNMIVDGSVTAEKMNVKGLTVSNGSKNTLAIDNAGNVSLDVTSLKITGSTAATETKAQDYANSAQTAAINAAKSYADGKLANKLDTAWITQENIFDKLTNNGALQGIFMEGGNLYFNATYIKSGFLNADRIAAGSITANKLAIGIASLVRNPNFLNWSGTYPDGCSIWSSVGGGISKQTVDNCIVYQNIVSATNQNTGLTLSSSYFSDGLRLDGVGYICLEARFRLTAGALTTGQECFLVDIYRQDSTSQRLALDFSTIGTTTPTLNKWYTVRKIYKLTDVDKTFKSILGYLICNWGSGKTKTIQVAALNMYIATEQDYLTQTWTSGTEIDGSNIKTGTLSASKITTGTLSADRINGGTISGTSINLGNGTFTVNTSGAFNATSGTIGGSNGFNIVNGAIYRGAGVLGQGGSGNIYLGQSGFSIGNKLVYTSSSNTLELNVDGLAIKGYNAATITYVDNGLGNKVNTSWMTQTNIFNTLTNNGVTQGIYMNPTDKRIYINAQYIATGILADAAGNVSWNLASGVLTAKKLSIDSTNFKLTEAGVVTATGGSIAGINFDSSKLFIPKTSGTNTFYSFLLNPNTYGASQNDPLLSINPSLTGMPALLVDRNGIYTQRITCQTFDRSVDSCFRMNGEVSTNSANGFRITNGSYGSFIRNDGNNTYFLLTDANNQFGSFNSLRPLYFSNANGNVTMQHNLSVSGSISEYGNTLSNRYQVKGNYAPSTHQHGQLHQDGYAVVTTSNGGTIFRAAEARGNEVVTLGSSTYKWVRLWAKQGTISTSDRNEKTDIKPLDERYEKLFMDLKPRMFNWKNFTNKDYHDRRHCGLIAQDVEEASYANGLSPELFAAVCKDNLEIPTVDGRNWSYGLIYSELHGLEIHMIQKNISKTAALEFQLISLKEENDNLKIKNEELAKRMDKLEKIIESCKNIPYHL